MFVSDLVGPAPSVVRWTCLMLDLQYILSVYLNRHHSHLKSVKLCANMAVKNMFTSDLLLDPGETFSDKENAKCDVFASLFCTEDTAKISFVLLCLYW